MQIYLYGEGMSKWANLSIKAELREELNKLAQELKMSSINDVVAYLLEKYYEYIKLEKALTNISVKLDKLLTDMSVKRPHEKPSSYCGEGFAY